MDGQNGLGRRPDARTDVPVVVEADYIGRVQNRSLAAGVLDLNPATGRQAGELVEQGKQEVAKALKQRTAAAQQEQEMDAALVLVLVLVQDTVALECSERLWHQEQWGPCLLLEMECVPSHEMGYRLWEAQAGS